MDGTQWKHPDGAIRKVVKSINHENAVICDDNTRWDATYFARVHEQTKKESK